MNKYKVFGVFITVAYLIISVWIYSIEYVLANWHIFGVIMIFMALTTLMAPLALKPFYHIWMLIGKWLGIANTFIVFTLIYFIIITPISIFRKIFKQKELSSNSNWETTHNQTVNFNKQF